MQGEALRNHSGEKKGIGKKLIALAAWLSGEDRKDCNTCRAAYAPSRWDTDEDRIRKSSGPPCKTCKPEVYPENHLPIEVYRLCSDDWTISPMGRIIGLRSEAIETSMRVLHVTDADYLTCFESVKLIGRKIAEMKCQP